MGETSGGGGNLCIKPLKVNCLSLPGIVIVVTIWVEISFVNKYDQLFGISNITNQSFE